MKIKCITEKTSKSVVAAMLGCTLAVSSVTAIPSGDNSGTAYAAWDGYREMEEELVEFSLLDMNEFGSVVDTGATASRKHLASEKMYSALWNNHLSVGDFWIKEFAPGVPSDWSGYNKVEMKIYSQKATGATIKPIIYAPTGGGTSGTYFHGLDFKVDWEGWKTVTLDLSAATAGQNSDWAYVNQFRLVSNGNWSVVGNPETELYIASIDVKSTPVNYDFTTGFYSEEKINKALSAMEGSVAVYAGAPNAVTSSGHIELGYPIEKSGDRIMVPVKLFEEYLGAEITDSESAWSVTLGGKTVSQDVLSYKKNSVTYIDGEAVAKALGLSAFTDGKLLVMGSEETYKALKRVENLGVNEYNEIVSQKTFAHSPDLDGYTKADCDLILDRWKAGVVGDETSIDLSDPDIASKVSNMVKNAKAAQSAIIRNPKDELFVGTVSNASSAMQQDYGKILSMAQAYACPGSELYKNEELKKDIIFCLDWMYENRFSIQGKANWKFTGFNNWYSWEIGAPIILMDILVCMKDELELKDFEKYMEYYTKTLPMPTGSGGNYTERALIIIGSALLRQDYKKVLQVQADFQKMYLFVDDNERITESQLKDDERKAVTPMKGAGYFTDGSYILHTLHAMNGTYGPAHFGALLDFEKLFTGSAFEMKTPLRDNVPKLFFDGVDKLLFGTTMYRHVLGRTENPNNANTGCKLLANMFMAAEYFEDDIRDEVYSIVKTAYNTGLNNKSAFISELTIDYVKKFKEVMADESVQLIKDYKLSKIYYNIDKTVHERDDWAIGVSMSSSRIFNYECINSNNMTGWYLGDGRTEYYLKGDNSNASSMYWSGIDPYRMPGTTVDTQERMVTTIGQGCEYLSSKDFVGGVALGNEYSAAAMHLESYHNDFDYPAGKTMSSYGGPAPAHTNDLVAQKSYYMLDDGVICLGTGVNAKNNNNAEVLTIIENMLAKETKNLAEGKGFSEPYEIKEAVASRTPEEENVAMNTIDSNPVSKWAGDGGEIVWDLGSVQKLGFAAISLLNGNKRTQAMTLQVSADGNSWETVFEGSSNGKQSTDEIFDLKNLDGRYVKYINHGNSAGSMWVSITECRIYPQNPDGTIGLSKPEIYGCDEIIADGEVLPLFKEELSIGDKKWISVDGRCGYYLPKENSENLGDVKIRWTNGATSYLEMWVEHGVNPTDGQYAYVLLPGASTNETKAFAESGAVSILANTNKLQAAKDNRTNVTYITFWEKGSFDGVTVSQPCMVVMQDKGDEFKIAVSDPTQKQKEINVTFNGAYTPVKTDEGAVSVAADSKTNLKLNVDGSAGRSFEFVYKK